MDFECRVKKNYARVFTHIVFRHQMNAANCYRKLFEKCGLQSGWFGCEYERTGTEAVYQQCTQNYCTGMMYSKSLNVLYETFIFQILLFYSCFFLLPSALKFCFYHTI